MSKEDLAQRIAFHRQQIKIAQDIEAAKPKPEPYRMLSREEIEKINEAEKRALFAGSGIIEAFEEIIEKHLLELYISHPGRHIIYDQYNSVVLEYDFWSHDGGHSDNYGDEYGCSEIRIEKLGRNKFRFNHDDKVGDAEKMIDRIAEAVAQSQLKKEGITTRS